MYPSTNKGVKIIIALILCLSVGLSFTESMDEAAKKDHTDLFKRSLVTFALVRTLNGVISVVQGTEIAAAPAGVGLTFTPGEILDPVNDLIERFSWVMLVSASSLALQAIVMEIGEWWVIKLTLTLSAGILVILFFIPSAGERMIALISKVFLICLVIRFLVPCVSYVNKTIYDHFLTAKYEKATSFVEEMGKEAKEISHDEVSINEPIDDSSVWDTVKNACTTLKETFKVKERIQALIEKLKNVAEYVIDLIAIFVLQSIVIPLLVLWGLLQGFSILLGKNLASPVQGMMQEKVLGSSESKRKREDQE